MSDDEGSCGGCVVGPLAMEADSDEELAPKHRAPAVVPVASHSMATRRGNRSRTMEGDAIGASGSAGGGIWRRLLLDVGRTQRVPTPSRVPKIAWAAEAPTTKRSGQPSRGDSFVSEDEDVAMWESAGKRLMSEGEGCQPVRARTPEEDAAGDGSFLDDQRQRFQPRIWPERRGGHRGPFGPRSCELAPPTTWRMEGSDCAPQRAADGGATSWPWRRQRSGHVVGAPCASVFGDQVAVPES